ncbi:MAG: VOC family protein [Erythrobacter sp.]
MRVLGDLAIRQVAYFVPDIERAARAHSEQFGSGPFFTLRHIALTHSIHRGIERRFDHSSAYGQWGDVMIEFVMQHGDEPSAMRDLYPSLSGRYGLHHMAVFVDRLDTAIADFEARGFPLAQLSETLDGTRFAFVDATASLGHMIEMYEPNETLLGFYNFVQNAADGWDGSDPVRALGGS